MIYRATHKPSELLTVELAQAWEPEFGTFDCVEVQVYVHDEPSRPWSRAADRGRARGDPRTGRCRLTNGSYALRTTWKAVVISVSATVRRHS